MRLRTLQRTKRKIGKMQEAKSATIAISRVFMCPLTSETEGEMNPDTVKYRAGSLLGGLLSLQLLYLGDSMSKVREKRSTSKSGF